MNEQQRQEQIERHLGGQMDTEEQQAFEKELASQPELEEAVQLEQAARAIVQEAGREGLKMQFTEFEEEWAAQKSRPVSSIFRRQWIAIAAAVVVLAIAIGWLFQPQPTPDLFATHFDIYQAPTPARGIAAETLFAKAVMAYNSKDYNRAAVLFEQSQMEANAIPYQSSFFQGVSFLAQKPPQVERAILAFDAVLASDNDFVQQALWYKALALFQRGEVAEAKTVLRQLQQAGKYKETEVTRILGKE